MEPGKNKKNTSIFNEANDNYRAIFELAPCYITVQDKDLRLLRYNGEFGRTFSPEPGDYCYEVYKGRSERCEVCPVLKTFENGGSHSSEETGISKDGEISYWLARTAPIRNEQGEVIAAIEMSIDLTQVKLLQEEIKRSEEKYRIIFNTIANPVFVLDAESLDILDCNNSVAAVYGFDKNELLGTSFLDLFNSNECERYASELKTSNIVNRASQIRKDGKTIYATIRVSPSDYIGRRVLMVTVDDITKRIITEQQLIQASKMATLGEMATGVAHELNQPLSVIKTASNFLVRKAHKGEIIQDDILDTLAQEIDSHVDRASRIIDHMREFGRKSDVTKEEVQVNDAVAKALDIFSQQLKLREITVAKDFCEDMPLIYADLNRLEQVFINLIINARDAIEKKCSRFPGDNLKRKIFLKTCVRDGMATIEIMDTGEGIPPSISEKIFEPFFTTKEVGKGTGLGLSISYGIVQDYNGLIRVESNEGEGSTFIIQFPLPNKD